MASLNGVNIRNLKSFRGHEGEPLWQGSVYHNGRKLGFWSQDAHGGSDNYDFNSKLLEYPTLAWKSALKGTKYYEYLEVDGFMSVVSAIMDLEKEYKKAEKKGYPVACIGINLVDGYWSMVSALHKTTAENRKSEIENAILKRADKGEEKFVIVKVISSVEELEFELGSLEGVKEEERLMRKKHELRMKELEEADKARKAQEEKRKSNKRFVAKQNGTEPGMIIKDKETGKTTTVPLYAYQNVMDALIDLFC